MLPEKTKKARPKKKNAFFRALSKLREEAAPERRVTSHRCSQTDEPFALIWERAKGEAVFTVKQTLTFSDDGVPAADTADTPAAQEFAVEDFDFSDRQCPHCGWTANFVHCTCGEYVCGAASYFESGQERFRHKRCGAVLVLKDATTIRASTERKARSKALPDRTKTKALPGPVKLIGHRR